MFLMYAGEYRHARAASFLTSKLSKFPGKTDL